MSAGSVVLSMGHSFQLQCRSSPWAAAFKPANAELVG
jgi:hypothetical protein